MLYYMRIRLLIAQCPKGRSIKPSSMGFPERFVSMQGEAYFFLLRRNLSHTTYEPAHRMHGLFLWKNSMKGGKMI